MSSANGSVGGSIWHSGLSPGWILISLFLLNNFAHRFAEELKELESQVSASPQKSGSHEEWNKLEQHKYLHVGNLWSCVRYSHTEYIHSTRACTLCSESILSRLVYASTQVCNSCIPDTLVKTARAKPVWNHCHTHFWDTARALYCDWLSINNISKKVSCSCETRWIIHWDQQNL